MPNYNKCVIYKLCCQDVEVKDIYIGSTCNMARRKNQHKNACNNPNNKNYYQYVYQFIRENGGFDNFDMIMIEEHHCENKLQKEQRERYWIELLKPALNRAIPTRNRNEYYHDNKQVIIEKQKLYNEVNKEQILKQKKEYYKQNKENLEKKNICECGGKFTNDHKRHHIKTKKHLTFINK